MELLSSLEDGCKLSLLLELELEVDIGIVGVAELHSSFGSRSATTAQLGELFGGPNFDGDFIILDFFLKPSFLGSLLLALLSSLDTSLLRAKNRYIDQPLSINSHVCMHVYLQIEKEEGVFQLSHHLIHFLLT